MYYLSSRKKKLAKKLFFMALTAVSIVIGVTVLTALMLGYSFNFNGTEGHVERIGILQVDSKPNGAEVYLNNQRHSTNTRARIAPIEGDYNLRIQKENYRTWQKQVKVKGGEITWVAYPRLIPNKLSPQSVLDLPKTLADALPSGSSRRYALLENATNPTVNIAFIDRDTPEFKSVSMPDSSYDKAGLGNFKLYLWSGNERYVVLKHIRANNPIEWLILDTEKPEESVNINQAFGIDNINEVVFGDYGGSQIYALIDGKVRNLDISNKTISSPLIDNVNNFSLYGDGYILFVQDNPTSKTRKFGYIRKGFKEPRIIKTLPLEAGKKAFMDVDKYYDRFYFLVSNGNQAWLYGSKSLFYGLPSDNKNDRLDLSEISKFSMNQEIISVNVTENGQLATVQDGKSFSTYNLESTLQSSTQIKPNVSGEAQKLRYLDTYMLWGDNNGTLRTYEFDGENQNDLLPVIAKFDATISPSGKYLYCINKNSSGDYQFVRIQLLDI